MTFNFVLVFIVAMCLNESSSADDSIADYYQKQYTREKAVGRSYSLTTCDYKTQIGYTCLNCNRALHCYAGNVAILVDCYGIFRYCRDGRCSRFQGEKCADNKLTTPATNVTAQTDDDTTEATTKLLTDVTATSVVESEIVTSSVVIEENSTTVSSASTSINIDNMTLTTVVENNTPSNVVSSTEAVDTRSNLV